MLDLSKIDLGKDEAEQDEKLSRYFLKTKNYENALAGTKTIILGRKGSGKSAIFKLLSDEMPKNGIEVVALTPDQYSWSALRDYTEQGIMAAQAHTNAWRLTFLSAVIWKLNELSYFKQGSKLVKYYQYMRDTFTPDSGQWLLHLVDKIKKALVGIKTQWVWLEETSSIATPLNIINQIYTLLLSEWPTGKKVRILVDRLDDSWDASEASKNLIIGLLKASNEINSRMNGKVVITTFLRSDIYDFLFFDDQDKLRQNEEIIRWTGKIGRASCRERV